MYAKRVMFMDNIKALDELNFVLGIYIFRLKSITNMVKKKYLLRVKY